MKILFIIDEWDELDLPTDTTFQLMAEALARKHEVYIVTPRHLFMQNSEPAGNLQGVTGIRYARFEYDLAQEHAMPLCEMDAILMRKNPPVDSSFLAILQLLAYVDSTKTFIMNSPLALQHFDDKLGIFEFPQFTPPSTATSSSQVLHAFLAQHKEIVLKPLRVYGGESVVRINQTDSNRFVLIEMLTNHGQAFVLAQKFLPEVTDGDKRVFVLDGKILGKEVRINRTGDHRDNIRAGGTSHSTKLTQEEVNICESIGIALSKKDLWLIGIDLIGGRVTEINVTSPGGILEINRNDGLHLQTDVIKFVEKMCMSLRA